MDIFIDLDGTIIDIAERYYILLKSYWDNDLPIDQQTYFSLRKRGFSERQVLENLGIKNDLVDKYLKKRIEIIEDKEVLRHDKCIDIDSVSKISKNHRLILLTYRKKRKNLLWQLNQLNIHSYFSRIITPDKDHQNAVDFKIHHLERSEVKNSIMIGDSRADIVSAKSVGVYSVGVLSGLNNYDEMFKLQPDLIINSISEFDDEYPIC